MNTPSSVMPFGNTPYIPATAMKTIELSVGDTVLDTAGRPKKVQILAFGSKYEGLNEYALVSWEGRWGRKQTEWVKVYSLYAISQ